MRRFKLPQLRFFLAWVFFPLAFGIFVHFDFPDFLRKPASPFQSYNDSADNIVQVVSSLLNGFNFTEVQR